MTVSLSSIKVIHAAVGWRQLLACSKSPLVAKMVHNLYLGSVGRGKILELDLNLKF